jgi:uracil-DNA glycosylase family protein
VPDLERPGAQEWVPRTARIAPLRRAAHDCRGCELYRDATQVVFSAGPATAPLMLVGEQPGDQEDREGEPFVGPAGRVLADALRAAGIDQAGVYVTNAVKHFRYQERGPGKARLHQKPGVTHINACRPWLAAELSAVKPEVVVCLGATAGRSVLGRPVRIGAERGGLLAPPDGGGAAVLITTHPSALLRLRGRGGWDTEFGRFVADLEVARNALS